MKAKRKITSYIVHILAAAALVLTSQISQAGSATWLSSPQDSAWENANNWTVGGPPNGPSDTATFAQSSQTGVNISTSQEVSSIVFAAGSASFGLNLSPGLLSLPGGELIIRGAGVINNSSVVQGFFVGETVGPTGTPGRIIFNNASAAASALISTPASLNQLSGR